MRQSSRLIWLVPLLVFAVGFIFLGKPDIDFLPITYKPSSPEVEALAIATTMTPEAQQLFYKQDPEVASKERFHDLCRNVPRNREKTVLLGCFTSDGYRGNIVIQSVTDSRLEGTMEVVAAHELLHAAYQKLDRSELKQLAPRLEAAANQVNDSFLSPVIKAYQDGNREIYHNELHSYLGTELETLKDPELEKYYQRYFSDRQAIIAFSKQSRSTLMALESQAKELAAEIDQLEKNLKYEESSLKQSSDDLDYRTQTLNQMRSQLFDLKRRAENALQRGDSSLVAQFKSTQVQFNNEVRSYNSQVESNRNRVARFNQDYETYKQKIEDYNQLNQNQRDILDTLKLEPTPVEVTPMPSE